jgi:16S rRNA (cytosine967-C5)-methyltransferase
LSRTGARRTPPSRTSQDPRSGKQDAGIASRAAALDLLDAVLGCGRPLDEAVEGHRRLGALTEPDRAFARNLAATTLRRLGQVDRVLDALLSRPSAAMPVAIRNLLRLGAAQLLFLHVPAHAAVHTAVTIARGRRHGAGAAALVNAVLRRIADAGDRPVHGDDAARINTPAWLWRSWCGAYGDEIARRIAEAHLHPPPLDLTARNDAGGLARRLAGRLLPTGSVRLERTTAVAALPGFAEGDWWVQDAAAALPALLLGDVGGRAVLDLCAAPGGKTAQLAAAGARVTAIDVSPARIDRLRVNLARLRLTAETVVADAREWRPPVPADAALVDVPCSATGTIRRHPDVARIKRPADVAALVPLQDRLLRAALEMVRPDGRIVYCACSLQPEEGPARVAALLGSGLPLRPLPIRPDEVFGLAELLTPEGWLRTLPCHLADAGGMDGFFAARLERG